MASTIAEETSSSASRISDELSVNVRGQAGHQAQALDLHDLLLGARIDAADGLFDLLLPVRSPISALCLRRTYLMIASSNLSPAILIEVDSTMPPSEMTAMSVVPPPMSRPDCRSAC